MHSRVLGPCLSKARANKIREHRLRLCDEKEGRHTPAERRVVRLVFGGREGTESVALPVNRDDSPAMLKAHVAEITGIPDTKCDTAQPFLLISIVCSRPAHCPSHDILDLLYTTERI